MEIVSVIMPCFNDGAYIEEAVASVLNQTYKSIELIIIDDGSTDGNTIDVLKKMEAEGITVLHSNHIGPSGARNYGISKSNGKYILPVDSDDIIENNYIFKAVEAMESRENIGIVYCHADLFGEKKGLWDLPNYSLEHMLLDNLIFVTALFRKDDWKTVGGFKTSMKHGMEDYDFWLSIIEIGREVFQLPEVLFHYRIKSVSRTTNFQNNSNIVKETYKTIYNNHPQLYNKYKDEYAVVLRNALIDQIWKVRMMESSMEIMKKVDKFPLLKKIAKKIYKRMG